MSLETRAIYAPPYAFRITNDIFGTVASEYAYRIFAPCLITPLCSCSVPGKYPVTSTKLINGILKQSQNLTNLEILSEELISKQPANTFGWLATIPTTLPLSLANPITILPANKDWTSKKDLLSNTSAIASFIS